MKLRRNKYLEKLGIKINSYGINFLKGLPYEKEYIKYEKKWGVNPAETFDLGKMLIEWLYTHLMEYEKRAKKVVDLNFNHIKCYDGVERTIEECLDTIIPKLRHYIIVNNDVGFYRTLSEMELSQEEVKKALHILADIFYDLWW